MEKAPALKGTSLQGPLQQLTELLRRRGMVVLVSSGAEQQARLKREIAEREEHDAEPEADAPGAGPVRQES